LLFMKNIFNKIFLMGIFKFKKKNQNRRIKHFKNDEVLKFRTKKR